MRALVVSGRARYLSVTEVPYNIESSRVRTHAPKFSKQVALTTAPEACIECMFVLA